MGNERREVIEMGIAGHSETVEDGNELFAVMIAKSIAN